MNLSEFPFGLLGKIQPEKKTLEFTDAVTARDGRIITRRWVVTGSDRYGLPVPDDEKVYVGLMQLSFQEGFRTQSVRFTGHQLRRLVGWPTHDGRYARKVFESLARLKGLTFITEHSFWNKEKKEYEPKKAGFAIIDNFELGRDTGFFKWNDVIWQSIQKGNIKQLDAQFFFSLKSPVARRVFRYLDKKFYRSDTFTANLRVFAFEHIGLSRYDDAAQIRRYLNPALDELIQRRYLKSYSYEKRRDAEYITIIRSPGEERQLDLPIPDEAKKPSDPHLTEQLVKRGVSRKVAEQLAAAHDRHFVRDKIELYDFLKDTAPEKLGRNPAGFLRKSIEDNYVPPEGMTTQAQRQEQSQRAKEQQQQQERAQKRREFDDWLKTTPEQKVKGTLIFWQIRFKKEQNRPPTSEEAEAKRQELLLKLPTPQQRWQQLFPGEDYSNEA